MQQPPPPVMPKRRLRRELPSSGSGKKSQSPSQVPPTASQIGSHGGSLLSSEGPAFEVYIDAAPCPRACFYAFSLSAQPKLRRADSHN